MIFRILPSLLLLACASFAIFDAEAKVISSPGNKLVLELKTQPEVHLSVKEKAPTGTPSSEVQIRHLGLFWSTRLRTERFIPKEIHEASLDGFKLITVTGANGAALEIRLKENLLAYRFRVASTTEYKIIEETAEFKIPELKWIRGQSLDCLDVVPDCFHGPHEHLYEDTVPMRARSLVRFPFLAQTDGKKVFLGHMNLRDHAGAYAEPRDAETLQLLTPSAPKTTAMRNANGFDFEDVVTREEFIGEFGPGEHVLPWRFVRWLGSEAELLAQAPFAELADSPRSVGSKSEAEMSWIERGFGTDEWITDAKIDLPESDLGFKSGINTETYKYYIDFAERFALKYIIIDAGWSANNDIYARNEQVDMLAIKHYAQHKKIKLILWVQKAAIANDLENKLDYLRDLGASAIKVDFIERDDIAITRFLERLYEETRKRKLMVILHGLPPPSGQDITHPHVMGFEAARSHEYDKWSDTMTPKHKLNVAFFRNPMGAYDSEGGGFRNLWPQDFKTEYPNPYSQGTRASEIAWYVFYDSKIQIIGGNLADYLRNPEETRFLTGLPLKWDEVIPLSAALDDHAFVAKRSGKTWYIAAVSARGEERRQNKALRVPAHRLLMPGRYRVTELKDCDTVAAPATCASLNQKVITVLRQNSSETVLKAPMAPYGGYVAKIEEI